MHGRLGSLMGKVVWDIILNSRARSTHLVSVRDSTASRRRHIKIYVSGTYNDQKRLREEAGKLFALGHKVTGTWLNEVQKPEVLSEEEWFRCLAVKDLAELAEADAIVCDLNNTSSSGGRYVEWGFALGRYNMLKVLVGPDQRGVFNTLADRSFTTWDEVINYFQENHAVAGH